MQGRLLYWGVMMALPLHSCINKNYDLGDLDTNILVPVENLTLPVKLDNIQLHTVLDIDKESQIKEYNGEYAVVVEGEFETEKIKVDNFCVKGASINDITSKATKMAVGGGKANCRAPQMGEINNLLASYVLPTDKTQLSISAQDITNAIKSLDNLKLDTKISAMISLDKSGKLKDILDSIRVDNFTFKLPRGFEGKLKAILSDGKEIEADKYDSQTGVAFFCSQSLLSNQGEIELEFNVTGLNEEVLSETMDQITQNNNFTLVDSFGVENGSISVHEQDFSEEYNQAASDEKYDMLPDELEYTSQQKMDEVEVKEFSGELNYEVKDFNIDPIGLEDIPKMLNQTGTCLNLANPQIYLSINNTVEDGEKKVIPAITSFEITAVDKNGEEHVYRLDEDEQINAKERLNSFYMSPYEVKETEKYANYEKAEHVRFSALGNLLSGGSLDESVGIPNKLIVNAIDTRLESSDVRSFALGTELEPIKGNYVFYAPLALTPNSRIRYTDTIDGWNSEELDHVLISNLKVQCEVSTDIPFAISLKVVPIDKYGKRINAEARADVKAKAKRQTLFFEMKGDIRELDGIIIDAIANVESSETLRPDMMIQLGKIKATVSGNYQTEL